MPDPCPPARQPDDDLSFRIAESFALINDWHAALGGQGRLDRVLALLRRQTGARRVVLLRIQGERVQCLAEAGEARTAPAAALARHLLRTGGTSPGPGRLWQLSDMRGDPGFAASSAATTIAQSAGLHELCLIVLDCTKNGLDMIALDFDRDPDLHPQLPLTLIAQALAEGWARRMPGLAAAMAPGPAPGATPPRQPHPDSADILGSDNPCGLSRAEQRVCRLLLRGDKAAQIATALNLRVATVRSHLRSIYAKSGTDGQVALIALNRGASARS
ncbi:LuxR C-terminal-related transcriptional regulator [Sulfitobacter aestuarii]|uniref:LuxR C-terminal-related transcriptional regulator n=1 Tax=Sulfitobacter aestuarii TaxID=2161676 RepID=A0ABW5U2B1_9RHOB